MMQRIVLLVIGSLLFLVPAAEGALCETACTSTSLCTKVCREWVGGPFTTCGDWGLCQSSGICTPNYQPVSSTPLGAFQVNYYGPDRCEHIVVERITWHDQKGCSGSSDYQTCNYYVNASRNDHLCCYYYTCGGQTSC